MIKKILKRFAEIYLESYRRLLSFSIVVGVLILIIRITEIAFQSKSIQFTLLLAFIVSVSLFLLFVMYFLVAATIVEMFFHAFKKKEVRMAKTLGDVRKAVKSLNAFIEKGQATESDKDFVRVWPDNINKEIVDTLPDEIELPNERAERFLINLEKRVALHRKSFSEKT